MLNDIVIYTPMYVTLFWAIVLLLSDRKKNLAKYFLGFFMLTAFLVYLSHSVFFKGARSLYLYFDPIYTFSSLLVYPLYYIYIKVLSVEVYFKKKNWILFAPALALGSLTLFIYLLMPQLDSTAYINKYYFNEPVNLNTTLQKIQRFVYFTGRLIFSIQVFYFLFKGSSLIKKYNKHIANFYSNTEGKSIVWVNLLLSSFVITSVVSIFFNMIGKFYFFEHPWLLVIPSAVFSILLFIIGFQGYMQNYTVRDLVLDEKEIIIKPIQTNNIKLKEHLIKQFEIDKIYRNSELKITDISFLLHTNRTYISRLINNDYGCSFSQFVNRYRINEAKELLTSTKSSRYTLEHICEKVGFGSLHSFIRVFKKSEGTTPGNYRELVN